MSTCFAALLFSFLEPRSNTALLQGPALLTGKATAKPVLRVFQFRLVLIGQNALLDVDSHPHTGLGECLEETQP